MNDDAHSPADPSAELSPSDFVDVDSGLVSTFGGAAHGSDAPTLRRSGRVACGPAPTRLGRYEVLAQAGSGGFGMVYRARCTETGRDVALKTLHNLRPDAVVQMKNEFRALAELEHPNLVRLYELGVDDGVWFIAMEWIDGVDFLTFVRPSNEPTSLPRLRIALAQLALALQATHEAGYLHLDIKPNNILVTAEGRVVLLDFGLAAHFRGVDSSSGDKRARGTPAYMAPEQVLGSELDESADWYGVGGVLYRALTGRFPFVADHLVALMAKKVLVPPEPIDAGESNAELSDLALALLAPKPEDRPTGPEVLERLHLGRASRETRHRSLAGRRAELRALRTAFERAAMPDGGAVVAHVRGPSGFGKSRLVGSFLSELGDDAVILTSRCFEQAHVPYRAFDGCVDVLGRLLAQAPDEEVEALMGPEVAQVLQIFPDLRQVDALDRAFPEQPELPVLGEARRRGFVGLEQLLQYVAKDKVLVLSLDDLQWSDSDSALLLTELLSSRNLPRFLLVASYRDEADSKNPVLDSLLKEDLGQESIVVEVGPLTLDESAALVAGLFGGTPNPERDHAIATQSNGSPLLVEELVERARTEAFLSQGEALGVEDLILARLARLPAELRAIAEVVSVADRPLTPDLLAEALADTSVDIPLAEAVERLSRYHLLRDDARIEPYHDRTRAGVIAQMHPRSLTARHAALAAAHARQPGADPVALAYHERGAGNREAAGRFAVLAAAAAERALAFGQAAEHYEAAVRDLKAGEGGGDSNTLQQLARRRADALGNAGRGREAGEAYLQCATDTPGEGDHLRRLAAEHFMTSAEIDPGRDVLEALLREHELSVPGGRKGAILGLVKNLAWLRLRGVGSKTTPTKDIAPKTVAQIELLISAYRGYVNFNTVWAGYFALEALRRSLSSGYEPGLITGLDYYGLMTTYAGTASAERRGGKLLDLAASIAARSEDPVARARIGLAYGVAATAIGRFDEAVHQLDQCAHNLEQCVGVAWDLAVTENTRVQSLVWLGQLKRARKRVRVLVRRSEQTGDLYSKLIGTVLDAKLRLASGRPAEARNMVATMLSEWTTEEFSFQHLFAIKTLVWCDLYDGDVEAAHARLVDMQPDLKKSGILSLQLMRAEASVLEGCVELARLAAGDGAASEARVRKLSRWLEKTGRPYARGYGAMLRAGSALVGGGPAEGDLRDAIRHFDAARMKVHAAALRRALGDPDGEAAMREEGIADPARWSQLYLPPVS